MTALVTSPRLDLDPIMDETMKALRLFPALAGYTKHLRLAIDSALDAMVVSPIWQAACTLHSPELKRALIDQAAANLITYSQPFDLMAVPYTLAPLLVNLVRVEAGRRNLL